MNHRLVVAGLLYRPSVDRAVRQWEFLLTQRAADLPFWPGRWTIPGGGVEMQDFPGMNGQGHGVLHRALIRELSEELGLHVSFGEPAFLGSRGFLRPDQQSVVVSSFLCPWRSGVPAPNEEVDAFAWVTAGESLGVDLIDEIRPEVARAEQLLSGQPGT